MTMATLDWSGTIAIINRPKHDGTILSHSEDVPIQLTPGPLMLFDTNRHAIGAIEEVELHGNAVVASGTCHFYDLEEATPYLESDRIPVDIETEWITRMTHRRSISPEGNPVIHNWRIWKALIVPEPAWDEAAITFTEQGK